MTSLFVLLLALAAEPGAPRPDPHLPAPPAVVEQRLAEQPFEILEARLARGIKEDVALRAEVRWPDGATQRIKIRRAERNASAFNNEPRFELAAWRLQRLFLDPEDYVVPPTALRALPLAVLKPHAPAAEPTFSGGDDVIVVLQAWLDGVEGPSQTFDAARAARDAEYERRVGQLNLLTYLIRHGDSNAGNILVASDRGRPRLFAVDNGVAFSSPDSDRGADWRPIRVAALPADAVARLRALDRTALARELAVVAEWRREGGRLVPVPPGKAFRVSEGVRRSGNRFQLGLTVRELNEIDRRRRQLLERIDAGRIAVR